MDARQEASRIHSWLQDAAGEVAYEEYRSFQQYGECMSPEYTRLMKRLKKQRVCDIPGSLADTLYGSADFCEDMVGDRIWWATKTDEERKELVAALMDMAHPALQKALNSIIKRHPEIQ